MIAITYDQLYSELDKVLFTPSRVARIRICARRRGEDPDVLLADVRMAMWTAFRAYDWNAARGGVSALAERVLRNALADFCSARRRDRLVLEETVGEAFGSESSTPDSGLNSQIWFAMAYESLNERRRNVFNLKFDPTPEWLEYLKGTQAKSTNVAMGKFLGYSKNQIDWDLRAIHDVLGALLLRPEFEALRSKMVSEFGWPTIWSSAKAYDSEMVDDVLSKQGLSSATSASSLELTPNGHRIIATTAWGSICFLRFGVHNATWVVLGQALWNSSHVIREQGSLNFKDVADWCVELETDIKERSMDIPRCFGEHDPQDKVCRGDPKSEVRDERGPCPVRDRCVAFKLYCEKTKTNPTNHMAYAGPDDDPHGVIKDPATLLPKLDKLISVHDITKGRIRRRKRPRKKKQGDSEQARAAGKAKTKAQQREAGKASSRAFEPKREDVMELVRWYLKQLSERSGLNVADDHGEAETGDLYVVDRTDKSGYVAVYVKRKGGARTPVTSVYLRPQRACVEVRIAAPFSAAPDGVESEDYTGKDGAFKIRIRNAKRSELSTIAAAVVDMFGSGAIELPEKS